MVGVAAGPPAGTPRDQSSCESLGLAWSVGTWLPFLALSVIDSRTSYLYYMVIVMPGIYVAAVALIAPLARRTDGWSRPGAWRCWSRSWSCIRSCRCPDD